MKSIKKLNDFIENNNIIIDNCDELDLVGKSALYFNNGNHDYILLGNGYKKSGYKKQVDILAEECGHYATTVGDYLEKKNTYHEKIEIDKAERKAYNWACNFLIDETELADALKKSSNLEEVADILEVSEQTIIDYLYFYSLKNRFFHIDENKKIDLYKLEFNSNV